MTLIVAALVVVGLLISALATHLFLIAAALNRTAGSLGDCLQNVRIIADQRKSLVLASNV